MESTTTGSVFCKSTNNYTTIYEIVRLAKTRGFHVANLVISHVGN